jgi:GAF domain-containing protein
MHERLAAAEAELARQTSVAAVVRTLCTELVGTLGASSCVTSRVVGDLLVRIAEVSGTGEKLEQLGHGYLLADYPLTRRVLERREPEVVSLDDPGADESEAALLRKLGFDALLMVPLVAAGRPWALVEVYGRGREFDPADAATAVQLAGTAGVLIERLSA